MLYVFTTAALAPTGAAQTSRLDYRGKKSILGGFARSDMLRTYAAYVGDQNPISLHPYSPQDSAEKRSAS